jgi:hypothetical protein
VSQRLERVRAALLELVRRCLVFDCEHASAERRPSCRICDQRAAEASEHLLESLPRIRGLLESDFKRLTTAIQPFACWTKRFFATRA